MMSEYDFRKMGNDIALKMMLKHRIREPTLCQVQRNSENSQQENSPIPAWLQNSEKHPGLPEHYLTLNTIENNIKSAADDEEEDMHLPKLPFEINRDIIYKLIIIPRERLHLTQPQLMPPLVDLMNGTVIVHGPSLADEIKHNIEIFLNIQGKLLPCCYAQRSEIITSSPFTAMGRARCYYCPLQTADPKIFFFSSQEKVLQCTRYSVKFLPRSVPYYNLH